MSDPTHVGVRVYCSGQTNGGAAGIPVHHVWSELPVLRGEESPTHLAIPLDAESLAGLRERITTVLRGRFEFEGIPVLPGDIDAVLAALGLDAS